MLRFKVGDKAKVIGDYSGHDFYLGEIVKILEIGSEYEPGEDCYLATRVDISDGREWYIDDEELSPYTNGDCVRQMNNKQLSEFLASIPSRTKDEWTVWLEEVNKEIDERKWF